MRSWTASASRVGTLLCVLLPIAGAAAAEPDSRSRLAVPAFGRGAPSSPAVRLATRLARAMRRADRSLEPLPPAEIDDLLAAAPDDRAAAARRCLRGDLEPETAAATRELLRAETLLLGGLTADGGVLVTELWDLRGPALLGRAHLTAATAAELSGRLDELAAPLLAGWPVDGSLQLDGHGRAVVDGHFTLDIGHRHGLRPRGRVWLLSDPERDESGAYAHLVGVGQLQYVGPSEARGEVESALSDDAIATARVAVAPQPRGRATAGGWCAPFGLLVGHVTPWAGTAGVATWWTLGGQATGPPVVWVQVAEDTVVAVETPDGQRLSQPMYVTAGAPRAVRLPAGARGATVRAVNGRWRQEVGAPAAAGTAAALRLAVDSPVAAPGQVLRLDLQVPAGSSADLWLEAPGRRAESLLTAAAASATTRTYLLATGAAGPREFRLRAGGTEVTARCQVGSL